MYISNTKQNCNKFAKPGASHCLDKPVVLTQTYEKLFLCCCFFSHQFKKKKNTYKQFRNKKPSGKSYKHAHACSRLYFTDFITCNINMPVNNKWDKVNVFVPLKYSRTLHTKHFRYQVLFPSVILPIYINKILVVWPCWWHSHYSSYTLGLVCKGSPKVSLLHAV